MFSQATASGPVDVTPMVYCLRSRTHLEKRKGFAIYHLAKIIYFARHGLVRADVINVIVHFFKHIYLDNV